jgi:hypothetical protein
MSWGTHPASGTFVHASRSAGGPLRLMFGEYREKSMRPLKFPNTMSRCDPLDDQNVTGVVHGGVHWKSFALKCRIVGHVYPDVETAAPVMRATALAPAVMLLCPVAGPKSPR